jgi:para-aminobenzoate synthetase component 1
MNLTGRFKKTLFKRNGRKTARQAPWVVPSHAASIEPAVPLVEELSPTLDPADAFQILASFPHVLFLDSALFHSSLGRFSFLTADPFEFLWSRGRRSYLPDEPRPRQDSDPFAVLAERMTRYRTERIENLPPFQGGAAGMFGYDLCHHLERLPRPRFDEFETPDLAVGFYDWVLAFDHVRKRTWLISTGLPEMHPRRRRRRAEKRLIEIKKVLTSKPCSQGAGLEPLANQLPISLSNQFSLPMLRGVTSNFHRDGYLQAVRRAIEYIHAGDCFQVNLSQRLAYPANRPAVDLYCRLRDRNPATFGGYFDLGNFIVASASPERFLRVENGEVETRPIKGTRPRLADAGQDQAQVQQLLHSAKDRAENIMIVDLLRNDLGRVCRYGSVRVEAVCRLESYQFVHHLVSEVRGQLREGLGPVDLLRAAFPGGSVTGAPKIRAMEIIAELEPTARGPYCGCLGYLGFDGSMDTNILIRTFTIGRGWIQFPVGGGIVADSSPEEEYNETWHKAEGLLRAVVV